MALQFRTKVFLVIALVAITIVIAKLLPPVSQSQAYHSFADDRMLLGITNVLNVISNIGFLIVGVYGFFVLRKSKTAIEIKCMYAVLYFGLILTTAGSAYYHTEPNNDTLVYDRIPMTIVFMSFLSATIAQMINRRAGVILFLPLLLLGIGSVLYWRDTQKLGFGDLRWYGLVQFLPILLIPLVYFLFDGDLQRKRLKALLPVVAWYVIAKVFEHFDREIYSFLGFVSGHTLKHLAAAVATFNIVILTKE